MKLSFNNPPRTTPKFATKEQYCEARKKSQLSLDDMPSATNAYQLPVDKEAVRQIENGEIPNTPTQTNSQSGIDYAGHEKFYGVMDYQTRLHLFYQLRGIIFLKPCSDVEKSVVKTDPLDLWGHMAATEENYVQKFRDSNLEGFAANHPNFVDRFDVLRKLLSRWNLKKLSGEL